MLIQNFVSSVPRFHHTSTINLQLIPPRHRASHQLALPACRLLSVVSIAPHETQQTRTHTRVCVFLASLLQVHASRGLAITPTGLQFR